MVSVTRHVLLVAGFALGLGAGAPATGSASEALSTGAFEEKAALILVRYTLLALDQANKSGNYAVLRELGAPTFRAANSPARLADIFAGHRRAKLDLAAASILEPVWMAAPERDSDGALHLAGYYPSDRVQTRFDMRFAPAEAGWRLSTLSVTLQAMNQAGASQDGFLLRR